MKKNILLLMLVLLLAACNHFTHNQDNKQSQSVVSSYLTPQPVYGSSDRNARLDSLLYLEQIIPDDTSKVWLYNHIGLQYRSTRARSDMEIAKKYLLRGVMLSEKLKFQTGSFRLKMAYANTLFFQLNDSCITNYQDALEIANHEKNEEWIMTVMYSLANAYDYIKEDYSKSLEYHLFALPFREKNGDIQSLAQSYNAIQGIFDKLELPEKGVEYGEKALELLADEPDSNVRGAILLGLCSNYSKIHPRRFEKELELLNESLRIALLQEDNVYKAHIYSDLSQHWFDRNEPEKSKQYALKALELDEELDLPNSISASMLLIARSEFAMRNVSKAKEWALKGYLIVKDEEPLLTQAELIKILCNVSLLNRNFDDYYFYLQINDSIKQILDIEKQSTIVQNLEAKYETAKKELEIERQQQVITRQNTQRWFLVSGVAVCALILVLLWYLLRLRNRSNRALAQMNATKDKFFNIISHDLKNPAIAQRDALRMLAVNGPSWDADSLLDYYNELLKSAEGNVALVYNLLDWARLQSGRMPFTPEPFTLEVCLNNDLSLIRKMAENKGISFKTNISDDVHVTGDRKMIATVVRNLLTNAVKFTASGGEISLSVEVDEKGKHIVSVSDTGVGMSDEQIKNLFGLDGTQSRTGTADEQGSGLGLIVCKELLEKHQSMLHINSQEGKGSRFWFEI